MEILISVADYAVSETFSCSVCYFRCLTKDEIFLLGSAAVTGMQYVLYNPIRNPNVHYLSWKWINKSSPPIFESKHPVEVGVCVFVCECVCNITKN